MTKAKVLVLAKANQSSLVKEVLPYLEGSIAQNIDFSNEMMCRIYHLGKRELNYKTFKKSNIVQKIRTCSIDQVPIISKNFISSDISVCNNFEYFCSYYGVTLVKISPLFKLIDEINKISR